MFEIVEGAGGESQSSGATQKKASCAVSAQEKCHCLLPVIFQHPALIFPFFFLISASHSDLSPVWMTTFCFNYQE